MKYAIMIARIIPPSINPLPVVFPTLTPTNSMIAPVRITMNDDAVPMNIRNPQISWKYSEINLANSAKELRRKSRFIVYRWYVLLFYIIVVVIQLGNLTDCFCKFTIM